ncbi:LacI family DNA-binding transcriptional regulator [Dietzia maris]|uniref:LacI family DNA-binding transcriptional regulator n=1 Tax=Dietzia maris TaxID=37915 RepID=UPI00223C24FF|nr:LacI family DNA-binding transcriptional regulator [Dietzia maris]MCT1432767.1 LacI family transcriptional regulator [Dietzia maris]MCT1521342.1 LacI family transcriptional regulator [Dietzia maris]
MSPTRRITLKDVARVAGVSVPQASLAMNGQGRVAPDTVRRVRDAADRLGYRPNPTARALRRGRADAVGLITRNLSNSYFLDVLRGMEGVASEQGSHIVVMDSGYDAATELAAVRRMADGQVSGLAIAPVGGTEAVDWWRVNRPDLPLVLLNVAPTPLVTTIGPDSPAAVSVAVDHLAELGHSRIGFVSAPASDAADTDRAETFLARCARLDVRPEILRTRLRFDAVREIVASELVDPAGLRTFLMNSDYTASAVYQATRDAGLVVGRDVSVVGHDDIPTSGLLAPALTTIGFDRQAVGVLATETLLAPEARPRTVRVPVNLVVRDSVVDLRG